MTFPLLERLSRELGYPVLDEEGLDRFLQDQHHSVLLFAGDPAKYPEALDVAVVLPELIKAFGDRLEPALIAPAAERDLQARFGFTAWPSLVFMRGEDYLGVISRVQDWSIYLDEIERLLEGATRRPPSVGVPVVAESAVACG